MHRLVSIAVVSCVLLAGCASRPPVTRADCDHALLTGVCRGALDARDEQVARADAYNAWYASLTPDQRFQYQMERRHEAFAAQQSGLDSMHESLRPAVQPSMCTTTLGTTLCN